MERLISAILWIMFLFEVRSSDPVTAALKHARRAAICCFIGYVVFLAVGFSFTPDGSEGTSPAAQIAEQVRHQVGSVFLIGALVCFAGMVWFTVRWFHIYFKPERYME